MSDPPTLVPNRECGGCNYCCMYLTIDTEELQVLPAQGCKHCTAHDGCKIYEARPPVCHSHFCGWRLSHLFDDSWRPDQIGMLMTVVNNNIPPIYMQEGLELLVIHPEITFARPDFYQFIYKAVENRVPIFVALQGPIGCGSNSILVNPLLEPAVATNNHKDFMGYFEAMVKSLATQPFKPIVFKRAPAIYN